MPTQSTDTKTPVMQKFSLAKITQQPKNLLLAAIVIISGGVLSVGAIAHEPIRNWIFIPDCRLGGDACVNAKVRQSVVRIETGEGSGSGVVIAPGKIVTSAHVVGTAPTVTVELPDGTKIDGQVVGFAKAGVDLALVEISGGSDLRPLPMSNSAKVGQPVFALGNPLDLGWTFTKGMVSQTSDRWIQFDAAINPGNSGGALVDAKGALVGIVTAIRRDAEGIALAIPLNRIEEFLEAAKHGKMPRTEPLLLPPDLKHDPTSLSLDDTAVKAQLTEASNPPLEDGSFFDVYVFEGKANQKITVTMSSLQINPYLIVFGPDGEKLAQTSADAAQGSRNAVLSGELPADGTYIIFANSEKAGEVGSYSIRVSAED